MPHRLTRTFYSGFYSTTVAMPFEQMHLDSVCTFWWHLFQSCHGSIDEAEDSLSTCWQSRKRYFDSINLNNKIYIRKYTSSTASYLQTRCNSLLALLIQIPFQKCWFTRMHHYLAFAVAMDIIPDKKYVLNISCITICKMTSALLNHNQLYQYSNLPMCCIFHNLTVLH